MRSPAGQFTASACHFVHWDNRGVGAPALQIDAGRAIVQGSTFAQDGTAVGVAADVTSVILTANQATGGFRVENRAGERTQLGFNEPDPVAWTPEARAHYRLTVGAAGDNRYLHGFHGPERSDRPFRWTRGQARLVLPVPAGKPAQVVLELHAPQAALAPDAGLYLAGQRIAAFDGRDRLSAKLPASNEDRARLELRASSWVPQKTLPASTDPRSLGVQLFTVTLEAEGAGPGLFNANTGRTGP